MNRVFLLILMCPPVYICHRRADQVALAISSNILSQVTKYFAYDTENRSTTVKTVAHPSGIETSHSKFTHPVCSPYNSPEETLPLMIKG